MEAPTPPSEKQLKKYIIDELEALTKRMMRDEDSDPSNPYAPLDEWNSLCFKIEQKIFGERKTESIHEVGQRLIRQVGAYLGVNKTRKSNKMAKHLKSGKIKLKIGEDEQKVLTYAVQSALMFNGEQMCIYLYCCLTEALNQILKGKWTFKRGEFLALACPQVQTYIDLPTQAILNEAFQLENKEISFSLNPQTLSHGQETEEKAHY